MLCVARRLHHRDAAAPLDFKQPGGAVVQSAGKNNADGGATVMFGRRSKQRVDRRAREVFARPARQPQTAVFCHQQMVVGLGGINMAVSQRLAVFGMRRRQRAGLFQQIGQRALVPTDMLHHANRRWDVRGQAGHQFAQCGNAAGRCADDDDGLPWHVRSLAQPGHELDRRSCNHISLIVAQHG